MSIVFTSLTSDFVCCYKSNKQLPLLAMEHAQKCAAKFYDSCKKSWLKQLKYEADCGIITSNRHVQVGRNGFVILKRLAVRPPDMTLRCCTILTTILYIWE